MTNNNLTETNNKRKIILGGAIASTVLLTTVPANAQSADPVEQVNGMVTSIGTITSGVVSVVVAALTVRLAVKQVNRLMTKG